MVPSFYVAPEKLGSGGESDEPVDVFEINVDATDASLAPDPSIVPDPTLFRPDPRLDRPETAFLWSSHSQAGDKCSSEFNALSDQFSNTTSPQLGKNVLGFSGHPFGRSQGKSQEFQEETFESAVGNNSNKAENTENIGTQEETRRNIGTQEETSSSAKEKSTKLYENTDKEEEIQRISPNFGKEVIESNQGCVTKGTCFIHLS